MTLRYPRRAFWGLLIVIALAMSCDDSNTSDQNISGDADVLDPQDAADADAQGADISPDVAITPQCFTPGEIVRCTEENSPGIVRCSEDGLEVESSCPTGSVCRDATCEEVVCVPGTSRCDSTTQPQRCADDGSAWVDQDVCEEGSRCEEGFCLNRCELAEQTNSYIGCEYWAVELENHMLDADPPTAPPESNDMRAPFAIVLANTSETYDAHISVYTGPGEFAEAIPSRTVESTSFPGVDLVTVHSEVLSKEGTHLYGPISGAIDQLVLPRGGIMTLILPYRALAFGKSTIAQKAYRVESTQPVVAYQFNPICCNYSHTNDASLLLPTSVLTPNYMFMSFAVLSNGRTPFSPTLTVMATEPDTEVTITLSDPKGTRGGQPRPYSELIYPFAADLSERVSGPDENGKISMTLQPYEALNVAGAGVAPVEDLTGSLIEASAPISVFGGHTCAYIPFASPACDHLENQLFPLETWGRRFIPAALKLRQPAADAEGTREGTYWKFVARENNTVIDVGMDIRKQSVLGPVDEGVPGCHDFAADDTGAQTGRFTLNAGQTCEFGTRNVFVAESSKPIMLGAFLSGQNSVTNNADWGSHAGDPSFFLVPPEEQYRNSYSFLAPATYHQSYVTVTGYPGMQITLDGEPVDLGSADYMENDARGVARAHIPVEPGPHTIKGHLPFGIVVYGYDDYVSYAYTGGLNFKKLTPWE